MNRVWCYYEPIKGGGHREVIKTEDQILEQYYDEWCERAKKAGKENLISPENCISDWVAVNWAYPKV